MPPATSLHKAPPPMPVQRPNPPTNAPNPLPKRPKVGAWGLGPTPARSGVKTPFAAPAPRTQMLAALAGMLGAVLVALPGHTAWGFAAFLVSNLAWLVFSAAGRHAWLFVQQLVFLASSVLGLWNWWLAPLLRG